jgi:hypothetical protein
VFLQLRISQIDNGLKFELGPSKLSMNMGISFSYFPGAIALVFVELGCGGTDAQHVSRADAPMTVSPSDDPMAPDSSSPANDTASANADDATTGDAQIRGSAAGGASIAGMLAGAAFNAVTAYSTMRRPFTCRGFEGEYESQIVITVSDEALCDPTGLASDPCSMIAERKLLSFGVTAVRASQAALGPGVYAIGTAVADLPFASAAALFRDAECNLAIHGATSGTVTLTSVGDSVVAGRIELMFSGGGSMSGSFVAPLCAPAQEAMGAECEPLPTCGETPTCRTR